MRYVEVPSEETEEDPFEGVETGARYYPRHITTVSSCLEGGTVLYIGSDCVCPARAINDTHFNIIVQKSCALRFINPTILQTRPHTIHNLTTLPVSPQIDSIYYTAKKEAVSRRTCRNSINSACRRSSVSLLSDKCATRCSLRAVASSRTSNSCADGATANSGSVSCRMRTPEDSTWPSRNPTAPTCQFWPFLEGRGITESPFHFVCPSYFPDEMSLKRTHILIQLK